MNESKMLDAAQHHRLFNASDSRRFVVHNGILPGKNGEGDFIGPDESPQAWSTTSELYKTRPPSVPYRSNWDKREIESEPYGMTANGLNSHKQDVESFLKSMTEREWASNFGMCAITRLMTRDTKHIVGASSHSFYIEGYPMPLMSTPGPERDSVMCTVPGNAAFSVEYQNNVKDRRFIAMTILFGTMNEGMHWTTALFDRKNAALIYLDTMRSYRKQRAKAAALAVRQYLESLEFPYSFRLFVMPLSEQPNNWSGGHLSIFSLAQLTGALAGETLTEVVSKYPSSGIVIDHGLPGPLPSTFSIDLWYSDWNLATSAPESSLEFVIGIMTAACLHELGIASHRLEMDDGRELLVDCITSSPEDGNYDTKNSAGGYVAADMK